jgi:hypothetical protein
MMGEPEVAAKVYATEILVFKLSDERGFLSYPYSVWVGDLIVGVTMSRWGAHRLARRAARTMGDRR